MTVALSRARLGLYILGRRQIFESCYELREAFELLMQRPDKLMLTTGEMFPTDRSLSNDVDETVPGEAAMEGVEHLGQYVFEMTNTRMKLLQAGNEPEIRDEVVEGNGQYDGSEHEEENGEEDEEDEGEEEDEEEDEEGEGEGEGDGEGDGENDDDNDAEANGKENGKDEEDGWDKA
jgi:intron-binding protein aquarius